MINDIERAMRDYEALVLEIEYTDAKGNATKRVVSPYSWKDIRKTEFIALCLSREEPRIFKVDRIANAQLKHANDYVMPVEIQ